MTRRHNFCPILGLLLVATAGCSGAGQETQNNPRVLAMSPARLVARADASEAGFVRLLVLREWTRDLERNAGILSGPRGSQVASVGFSGQFQGDGWGTLIGYTVGGVLWVVVELVKLSFGWMIPDPTRAEVIEYQDAVREPVLQATIGSRFGGPTLDLGIQPLDGYRLDEDSVNLLGGPGAEVVIHAGELSVTTSLPSAK